MPSRGGIGADVSIAIRSDLVIERSRPLLFYEIEPNGLRVFTRSSEPSLYAKSRCRKLFRVQRDSTVDGSRTRTDVKVFDNVTSDKDLERRVGGMSPDRRDDSEFDGFSAPEGRRELTELAACRCKVKLTKGRIPNGSRRQQCHRHYNRRSQQCPMNQATAAVC
jgi:hypothetical protein